MEEELVLLLNKDELFDRHILLPHAELNQAVYQAVDQFVEKYGGSRLRLVLFCEPLSESTRNIFREAYASHYEDEYRKVLHYLRRRYWRIVMMLLLSLLAFCLWVTRGGSSTGSVLWLMVSNVGAFCLWEIGYTHFDRADAFALRKRIVRARTAEIEFHITGKASP